MDLPHNIFEAFSEAIVGFGGHVGEGQGHIHLQQLLVFVMDLVPLLMSSLFLIDWVKGESHKHSLYNTIFFELLFIVAVYADASEEAILHDLHVHEVLVRRYSYDLYRKDHVLLQGLRGFADYREKDIFIVDGRLLLPRVFEWMGELAADELLVDYAVLVDLYVPKLAWVFENFGNSLIFI